MIKTEACKKVLDLGGERQCTLTYYLVSSDKNDDIDMRQYGVGISIPERNDEELVGNITPDREKAMQLIDLVASNFVTPVTLRDVVYDWLCM